MGLSRWWFTPGSIRIPANGILIYDGVSAPSGYSDYLAAEDCYIIGAGDTYTAEDTADPSSTTITLATDGAHAEGTLVALQTDRNAGAGSATCYTGASEGDHDHEATVQINPDAVNVRLIQASAETGVPSGAVLLSDGVIPGLDLKSELNDQGGFLRADSVEDFGLESRNHIGTESDSDAMAHDHRSNSNTDGYSYTSADADRVDTFPHTHDITVTGDLAQVLLKAYEVAVDLSGASGSVIILWPNLSLPTGWSLCDGTGGTPDTTNRYIKPSATGAGTLSGDNSFTAGVLSSSETHDHAVPYTHPQASVDSYHSSAVSHEHDVTWTQTLLAKYFALNFIKYTG